MSRPIDLPAAGLLGLGQDAVLSLRSALLRDFGADAAGYLQQAGYAGGDAVHGAFAQWLERQGHPMPESLDIEAFSALASAFFEDLGWGSFGFVGGAPVATIDSPDWVEANGMESTVHPCCHLGTGLLASFFGRIAEQPLAVMEVECRATGATHCRFLLGSADVMQRVWEGMAAGEPYGDVLSTMVVQQQ